MPSYNSTARLPFKTGGRVGKQIGGRANLLEEVGRIDAERMNPNRRAEKARVIGELNKGYNKGGRVGLNEGTKLKYDEWVARNKKKKILKKEVEAAGKKRLLTKKIGYFEKKQKKLEKAKKQFKKLEAGLSPQAKIMMIGHDWEFGGTKPTLNQAGRIREGVQKGGRIGLKKGSNGKWIQSATASIKRRGTEGVCTGKKFGGATCPPGSKRYNLAKTFKKMGKARKA